MGRRHQERRREDESVRQTPVRLRLRVPNGNLTHSLRRLPQPLLLPRKHEPYALERELGVETTWRPFAVDIEGAYGGTIEERTERDWRKVRYSYMDARRLANRRGLVVRGPQKIFDASNVHIGMLHAQ